MAYANNSTQIEYHRVLTTYKPDGSRSEVLVSNDAVVITYDQIPTVIREHMRVPNEDLWNLIKFCNETLKERHEYLRIKEERRKEHDKQEAQQRTERENDAYSDFVAPKPHFWKFWCKEERV